MANYNKNRSDELPSVCSACKSVVDQDNWHPTRTTQTDSGEPQLHIFCDEQCRNDWLASQNTTE